MSRLLFIVLGILMFPLSAEWEMVWNDEFDKKGAPNPKKWTYEEGFVRNKEDQYYTKNRRVNARVEKGNLIIEAKKERYRNKGFVSEKNPSWQKNRQYAEYTSACLITQGLAAWKYGKVEIRAKLPVKKGAWPAFWMMGADRSKVGWPKCGEIDIMEHVTSDPGTIHGTLHWPGDNPAKKLSVASGSKVKSKNLDDWHTYGIEWSEKEIKFYFDGKRYGRVKLSKMDGTVPQEMGDNGNPFRKPHYLLINLAVGGAWGGPPDPSAFPQQLVVDYVRIYRKKEEPTGEKATGS